MDNARTNDPATSQEASMNFEALRQVRKKQFLDGLAALGGLGTAREAVSMITKDATLSDSIRRRASDLVRTGEITIVGSRRCSVSNHKATIYKLREHGNGNNE